MASLAWPYDDVADALFSGLCGALDAIEEEQARRGLDVFDEVELHPLLAGGLQHAGFGCFREERYPTDRAQRKKSEGRRCDLVVTPDALALDDGTWRQPTLFDVPGGCALADALWVEVKVAARFKEGGRSGGSARVAWKDVEKLAGEDAVRRRAVLLVLFTEDEDVAAHDLAAWAALGRGRGLLLEKPVVRGRRIVDRYGNGALVLGLFPVAGLARAPAAPRRSARSSVG